MNKSERKKFWSYSIFSSVVLIIVLLLTIIWAIYAYPMDHQKNYYWWFFAAIIIGIPLATLMSFTCLEFTENEVTVGNPLISCRVTYELQQIKIFIEKPISISLGNKLYLIRLSAIDIQRKDRYIIYGKAHQEAFAKFARENDIKIMNRRIHK